MSIFTSNQFSNSIEEPFVFVKNFSFSSVSKLPRRTTFLWQKNKILKFPARASSTICSNWESQSHIFISHPRRTGKRVLEKVNGLPLPFWIPKFSNPPSFHPRRTISFIKISSNSNRIAKLRLATSKENFLGARRTICQGSEIKKAF